MVVQEPFMDSDPCSCSADLFSEAVAFFTGFRIGIDSGGTDRPTLGDPPYRPGI